jgi:hypothetical protein
MAFDLLCPLEMGGVGYLRVPLDHFLKAQMSLVSASSRVFCSQFPFSILILFLRFLIALLFALFVSDEIELVSYQLDAYRLRLGMLLSIFGFGFFEVESWVVCWCICGSLALVNRPCYGEVVRCKREIMVYLPVLDNIIVCGRCIGER